MLGALNEVNAMANACKPLQLSIPRSLHEYTAQLIPRNLTANNVRRISLQHSYSIDDNIKGKCQLLRPILPEIPLLEASLAQSFSYLAAICVILILVIIIVFVSIAGIATTAVPVAVVIGASVPSAT